MLPIHHHNNRLNTSSTPSKPARDKLDTFHYRRTRNHLRQYGLSHGTDCLTKLRHVASTNARSSRQEGQDVASIGIRRFLRPHHGSPEKCVDVTLPTPSECFTKRSHHVSTLTVGLCALTASVHVYVLGKSKLDVTSHVWSTYRVTYTCQCKRTSKSSVQHSMSGLYRSLWIVGIGVASFTSHLCKQT